MVSGVLSGPNPASGVGIARSLRAAYPHARLVAAAYSHGDSGLNWPDFDDRLIFLLALANAKSHYGRQDAGNAMQEMEVYLHGLVAGSHQTRRYIPGTDMRADMIYVRPKPSVPFS